MADDEAILGGSLMAGGKTFVAEGKKGFQSVKDKLDQMNKADQKAHNTAELQAHLDLQVQKENKAEIIKRSVEEGVWQAQKSKHDDLMQKQIDRQIKFEMGESGFAGLKKKFSEGFAEMIDAQKTVGERLTDIGDAFSDDLSFLGDMMSPLSQLPGVNTALTILKSTGGTLLSLATAEGRQRVKDTIANAKQWAAEKAQWVWAKSAAAASASWEATKWVATKAQWALENAHRWKEGVAAAKRFAWNKALAMKKALKDRAETLKGNLSKRGKGGLKKAKGWLMKAVGVILGLVVGLFAMIGAFAAEVLKPFKLLFSGIGARITKLFKPIKLPAKLTNGIKIVKDFFGKIGKFFGKIIAPFQKAVGVVSKLANPKIVGFMKTIGGVFGKLFWPITLLMGAWNAVKGFIAGFKSTEGGIGEKIMGGLLGAWQSLVDYLIMWPLDLIKDLIAWIGEKMGFDMSAVKDFSFSDMWKDISDKFIDGVMAVIRFVKAIAAGIGAGIAALWPGGEGPMEAFKRKFDEVMAQPGGGKASTIEKPEKGTGEEMETEEAKREAYIKERNARISRDARAHREARKKELGIVNIHEGNKESKIVMDGTTPQEKTADSTW